ncbi:MAG: hypothetical protein KC912_10795 [Proteobacteria bacterium]|nr:hypothetical protein [Pseudomonadota bacterium]
MQLLSWNLFGLEDAELDERTEAALFISMLGGLPEQVLASAEPPAPPPEILMFQEVVDRSLDAHLRPHLSAAGYTLVHSSRDQREYYELIAVRAPFSIVDSRILPLDSAQGRELLEIDAECEGKLYRLSTAHLESMQQGKRLRMGQTRFIVDRLRAWQGPALFGGDTNLRVAEAEAIGGLPDAWEATGSVASERWTRVSERTQRKARYDRIWGHGVRFSGFRCLGREPVTPTGQPPSDHLGVRVGFRPA